MKCLKSPVNRGSRLWAWLGPVTVVAATLPAEGADPFATYEEEGVWFVRAGARMLFNVQATVKGVREEVTPGVYNDGFVLPDVNGVGSATTSNWGYDDAAQLLGNQVRMSRLTGVPLAGVFRDETSDPSYGGEIVGGAEMARFDVGQRELRFGYEVGYGYNSFSLKNRSQASGTATLSVAGFGLGGVAPPTAPYAGTFQGPGPAVSLQPSFSGSQSSVGQSTFEGELESDMHSFKLGFWFEYPLTRRLKGNLSFGYSSIFADTRLKYREGTTFANPAFSPIETTRKTVGGRDWRPGAYAQLRLHYDFNRHVAAYLGGDVQFNEDLEFEGKGRAITLDMGGIFAASAGLVFKF